MQEQLGNEIEQMGSYVRIRKGTVLDREGIAFYRKKFLRYRLKGIVIGGDFESDSWTLTDGLSDVKIRFRVDKDAYEGGAGGWTGISHETFQECMRAFLALLLGRSNLLSLKQDALELRRLAETPYARVAMEPCRAKIIEFLELLPGASPYRDDAIERMEERRRHVKRPRSGQRDLAPFHEYLEFDRLMKRFWSNAGDNEKVRYFPVWFWWNLTMILPLRVVEFLVTPLDCLAEEEGCYTIRIRRSRRKKAGEKVAYRVEEDYPESMYPVSRELAEGIIYYKEKTAGQRPDGNWSLLLPRGSRFGYMTYVEMSRLLDSFCSGPLGGASFHIRLGDTRHLSMMNLILSGGAPEVCRELAGHEDIDISSHYYSNLSPLIDSAIYRGHGGTEASFTGAPARLPSDGAGMKVRNGWCRNDRIHELDIGECLKNYHSSGHMGDCRGCSYFSPEGLPLHLEIRKERADSVDQEWDTLIRAVDLLRKDRGAKEDILAILARLKNEMYRYNALDWAGFIRRDGTDGTAEKEQPGNDGGACRRLLP